MKYIKNKILIISLASGILGCSQSATSVFEKDPIYAQNIQYTKVIKSIAKDDVQAIFNITYLNSVESSKWDNEKQNFLIGSYTFNNNPNEFHLSMNDTIPTNITLVKKTDSLYKDIAFKNNWATYKIVSFAAVKDTNLTLQYTHPEYKTISVNFIKE